MTAGRAVITVLNSIGPTSMPLNEFVLYRARRFPSEKHFVIVLGPMDAAVFEEFERKCAGTGAHASYCATSVRRLAGKLKTVIDQGRLSGDRVLVHLHHPRSGLAFQRARLLFRRRAPVLFTVHNQFSNYSKRTQALSGANFLLANRVSFVGEACASSFPKILRSVKGGRLDVIPNGVDLERVDELVQRVTASGNARRAESRPASVRLLNVGRLVEQKNQAFLIRLLARLPATTCLRVIGKGPLQKPLEALAREAGVADRIGFLGRIPREDVYREMLAADLFVSPSHWEGLPIAVMEAMALRLPVLLSRIGPHRDLQSDRSSVRLASDDPAEWAEIIESLMAMPRPERERIGQENRRIVESTFSLERMHERYERLYAALAA